MAKSHDGYRYREGKLYCWSKMIAGKRVVVKAKTHGEREIRIKARMAEREATKPVDPQSVTAYLEGWLANHVRPNRAYKTHEGYSQNIRLYVTPAIGEKRIALVVPDDLQSILNGMTESGLERSVALSRSILRRAFAQAKAEGLTGINPAASLTIPTFDSKSMRVLSPKEVKSLVSYQGSRFCPLFCLLLATGLRISEALGLTSADIFEKHIHVECQLVWRKEGAFSREKLKSPSARRDIPLSPLAIEALSRMARQVERDKIAAKSGYTPHGFLFPTESGKPSTPSNAHRALKAACAAIKIPPASDHDLRRTFLTNLARHESRPQILKAIAGHASLSTTMKFYIQSNADDEADAVARSLSGIM